MEKPEWFETVDALEGAPDSVAPSSTRARTARLTQGFVLLGVATVIAVGGFAFAQSTSSTSSSEALSSVSGSSIPAAVTGGTAVAASQGPAGVAQAAVTGGKPSITGAAAGGDGNDQASTENS